MADDGAKATRLQRITEQVTAHRKALDDGNWLVAAEDGDPAAPGSGCEHRETCDNPLSSRLQLHRTCREPYGVHRAALPNHHAPCQTGRSQTAHHIARVDHRVIGIMEGACNIVGKQWHAIVDFLPIHDDGPDTQSALDAAARQQGFELRAGCCNSTAPEWRKSMAMTGFAVEFFHKLVVKAKTLKSKLGPCSALLDFASRRQHAGARPTRFLPHTAPVQQDDARARLGQPPCNGRADDSSADHRDLGDGREHAPYHPKSP